MVKFIQRLEETSTALPIDGMAALSARSFKGFTEQIRQVVKVIRSVYRGHHPSKPVGILTVFKLSQTGRRPA
ncbi:hypothetical protein [Deinococcus ruber]|uniref:hypothetical protein n=1 Tax=Deinococcus ruber TaxID=1848197 RepID=UPI00166B1879|nr:hypothetical protein [Deinococcus ruber]